MDENTPCPNCGAGLELGLLAVKGTVGAFLFVGFSYQHLWWAASAPAERAGEPADVDGVGRADHGDDPVHAHAGEALVRR